jgi:hypothetical protein
VRFAAGETDITGGIFFANAIVFRRLPTSRNPTQRSQKRLGVARKQLLVLSWRTRFPFDRTREDADK